MIKFRLIILGRSVGAVTLYLPQCVVPRDLMWLILVTVDTNFDQRNKVVSAGFLHCNAVVFSNKEVFFNDRTCSLSLLSFFSKCDVKW